jgi:hypothetical protein
MISGQFVLWKFDKTTNDFPIRKFKTLPMKKIIITLLLIHGIVYAQKPCPEWGSAKKGTLAYTLNLKKNRVDIPDKYKTITINDFPKLPDDSTGDGQPYKLTHTHIPPEVIEALKLVKRRNESPFFLIREKINSSLFHQII